MMLSKARKGLGSVTATLLLVASGVILLAPAAHLASNYPLSVAAWCEKNLSGGSWRVNSKAVTIDGPWSG